MTPRQTRFRLALRALTGKAGVPITRAEALAIAANELERVGWTTDNMSASLCLGVWRVRRYPAGRGPMACIDIEADTGTVISVRRGTH